MDEKATSPAPRHVIDCLDQSIRDIASGNVMNGHAVQGEARRMLTDYKRAPSATPTSRPRASSKSVRAR
jgi:hypothetical protein